MAEANAGMSSVEAQQRGGGRGAMTVGSRGEGLIAGRVALWSVALNAMPS